MRSNLVFIHIFTLITYFQVKTDGKFETVIMLKSYSLQFNTDGNLNAVFMLKGYSL